MVTGDAFPGLTRTQINDLIAAYVTANAAPISHTHNASAITDGTLDAARLPDLSGTYATKQFATAIAIAVG